MFIRETSYMKSFISFYLATLKIFIIKYFYKYTIQINKYTLYTKIK